ncbi:MAG TPA: FAD-dependent oxidoreductase [Candidatus Polarisedimenticolaceae bacterium]|nr:FAD-dependent oxidoreductase [Candidatus Polarisedimenticolaceae bacterium]
MRVIIVGSGIFGITTSLALRARGHVVTLLDAGIAPREEAASTDISKIVRMDYGADAFYTELMERAILEWRRWNARWPRPLFHETGFLLLSRTILETGTFEGDSLALLTSRGHDVTRLTRRTLRERFPAWDRSGYVDGYFNPSAGWVESGAVVACLMAEAREAGVVVRNGTSVRGLEAQDADATVVAAGAWTTDLLPHLSEALWPVAQPVFHLKPPDPERWRADRFPVWAADIARTGWYGFPANADGIVKIANHGPGRRVEPDAPRVTLPSEEAALRRFLEESLPELAELPLRASKTCLYSDSFDGDFWIGADPDRPGLVVAAGDSGHGFKFAPVLGAIVADAVEGRANDALRRFGWRTPSLRKTEDARFGMS